MIVFDVQHKHDNFDEPIQAIGAVNVNNPKNEFSTSSRVLRINRVFAKAVREFDSETIEIGQGVNLEALMLSQFFRWAEGLDGFEGISYCFDEERSQVVEISKRHGLRNPFEEIRDIKDLYLKVASTVIPATREEIIRYAGITGVDYYKANALEKARIAGEVVSRISVGKNLFPKYKEFGIPMHLTY